MISIVSYLDQGTYKLSEGILAVTVLAATVTDGINHVLSLIFLVYIRQIFNNFCFVQSCSDSVIL